MKTKMKTPKTWKNWIDAISSIVEEATFSFTPDGVEMKSMDPSRVALVDFNFPADGFEKFEVEESTELGLNLLELNKILSRGQKDDQFVLELKDSMNQLLLKFKGRSTRRFTMPLIEKKDEEISRPDLDFSSSAEIKAKVLKDGLKDASLVSDNVSIRLLEESLKITADSDTGSTETTVPKETDNIKNLKIEEPSKSLFNLEYLEDMVGAANSGDFIEVKAANNIPIQLKIKSENGGSLRFVLAPRIETEK